MKRFLNEFHNEKKPAQIELVFMVKIKGTAMGTLC